MRRALIAGYLVLLAASHIWMLTREVPGFDPERPQPGRTLVEVPAMAKGGAVAGERCVLSLLEWGGAGDGESERPTEGGPDTDESPAAEGAEGRASGDEPSAPPPEADGATYLVRMRDGIAPATWGFVEHCATERIVGPGGCPD